MNAAERLARVRELFDRMIALPEFRRRDELERACPDDPGLCEEVLELLRIDERDEAATADSISQLESGEGASWLAEHLAASRINDCLPQMIGPYQIIRVVGHGSMGMVYEAHQPEPARSVALKMLHPGLLGPGTLRRFQREARALASLKHPGVVALYEVGSAPIAAGLPPQPYLVMELVEGGTLRTALSSRSMPVEQQLELIAMLCEAVHAAHQRGIVHRDLKPDNIVLTPLNENAALAKHHPGV